MRATGSWPLGCGVATFLTGALDLANAEPGTPVWFALRTDDVTFWIVDAFPGDAERQAHINGEIANALMANAERLRAQPPSSAWPTSSPPRCPAEPETVARLDFA